MNTPAARRWPQVRRLHLVLASLGAVVVDEPGAQAVRAEDATGRFTLWPGHADFLTVLSVGVLGWRDAGGAWHHCAVRGGVLTLRDGWRLQVATREAIPGDDLAQLETTVRQRLAERQQREDTARRQARQLELQALQQLLRPLRPLRPPQPVQPPGTGHAPTAGGLPT